MVQQLPSPNVWPKWNLIAFLAVKQLNVTSKPPPPAATKNVRCNSIPNRNCTTDLGSLESDDVDEKNEKNVEKVKNLLDSKSGVSEDLKENLIAVSVDMQCMLQ